MQLRVALFDFDNTLAPSLHFWVDAFRAVFDELGVPMTHAEAEARCLHRNWDEVADDVGVCSADELRDRMHVALPSAYERVELYPHARSVVTRCRTAGLATGLVTSSPRALIIDVLDRLDLADAFDAVVCGDDVVHMKPHPEPVLAALDLLGHAVEHAVMIGDSVVDVLAGRAAGTRTALLVPPHADEQTRSRLTAMQADHHVADLEELALALGV